MSRHRRRRFAGPPAIASALIIAWSATDAAATTKLQGKLVLHADCDARVAAADCAIDELDSGKFVMRRGSGSGSGGVSFKLTLRGLRKNGDKLTLSGVRAAVLLSIDGGPCRAHFPPPFQVEGGRVKGGVVFGGADTVPAVAPLASQRIEPCGERVAVIAPGVGGDDIIAVDGLVQGPQRPPSNLRGSLVLAPGCNPAINPAAGCVADTVGSGTFLVRSSPSPSDDGLSFRVRIAQVARGGALVDATGVRAVFSLTSDGRGCFEYFSPVLELAAGRLRGKTRFGGNHTFPPVTPSPGSSVELCGNRVRVFVPGASGGDVVAVAGLGTAR